MTQPDNQPLQSDGLFGDMQARPSARDLDTQPDHYERYRCPHDGATQLNGCMSAAEYEALERALFDRKGARLARFYRWARAVGVSPIAALVLYVQNILLCLPAGTVAHIGRGEMALNTFVALIAPPGCGKSFTINRVTRVAAVTIDGAPVTPTCLSLGSGEGFAAPLQSGVTDDGRHTPPPPILWLVTEVGNLASLLERRGTTLRGNLLSAFSGEQLGTSNKNEVTKVDAGSYSTALVVAAQPEKAGVLVSGADDGLTDRFIFVETIDPFAPSLDRSPDDEPQLWPVEVHEGIQKAMQYGFTFPEKLSREIDERQRITRRTGVADRGTGHELELRVRLACGLALMHETLTVDRRHWDMAGKLVDYSRQVLARTRADAQLAADDAEQRLTDARRVRVANKLLDKVGNAGGATIPVTPVWQSFRGSQRDLAREVCGVLIDERVLIHISANDEDRANSPRHAGYIAPGSEWVNRAAIVERVFRTV